MYNLYSTSHFFHYIIIMASYLNLSEVLDKDDKQREKERECFNRYRRTGTTLNNNYLIEG